jgi:hypothetical protein
VRLAIGLLFLDAQFRDAGNEPGIILFSRTDLADMVGATIDERDGSDTGSSSRENGWVTARGRTCRTGKRQERPVSIHRRVVIPLPVNIPGESTGHPPGGALIIGFFRYLGLLGVKPHARNEDRINSHVASNNRRLLLFSRPSSMLLSGICWLRPD